jgi:hypothetical protein
MRFLVLVAVVAVLAAPVLSAIGWQREYMAGCVLGAVCGWIACRLMG